MLVVKRPEWIDDFGTKHPPELIRPRGSRPTSARAPATCSGSSPRTTRWSITAAFAFLDALIASDMHFETAGSPWGGRRLRLLASGRRLTPSPGLVAPFPKRMVTSSARWAVKRSGSIGSMSANSCSRADMAPSPCRGARGSAVFISRSPWLREPRLARTLRLSRPGPEAHDHVRPGSLSAQGGGDHRKQRPIPGPARPTTTTLAFLPQTLASLPAPNAPYQEAAAGRLLNSR